MLHLRHALDVGSDGSSPLGHTRGIPQLSAADFKPGYHLVVGEPKSDRYDGGSVNRAPHQAASVSPSPARDAVHRKARRATGPVRAGFPDSEHIGTGGVSGYPAPTYLERIWGVTYVS